MPLRKDRRLCAAGCTVGRLPLLNSMKTWWRNAPERNNEIDAVNQWWLTDTTLVVSESGLERDI